MTKSLTLNDIPEYLKNSELCKNIESDESFDVPIELFRKELIINTCQDLIDYLKIFDYWMINKIPDELYKFVIKNKDKINMKVLNNLFYMNDLIKQISFIVIITNDKICSYASENGYLDLLKYAHKNAYFWNEETCNIAAKNGHLGCLKYAHENGCIWDIHTCISAGKNGHLDCLKYAHENGCTWNEYIKIYTASNGHLDCLMYAHENGCPWEEDNKDIHYEIGLWNKTCSCASQNGHLDCLKYAHEHGCPWDSHTCSGAAFKGHLDCLKYAHENGCPWNIYLSSGCGYLECLKYAHENGCPLSNYACIGLAEKGHLNCLKYVHENGCSLCHEALSSVAFYGHLNCLKYIHENGYILNGCAYEYILDDSVLRNVIRSRNIDCIKYIIKNKYTCKISKLYKKRKIIIQEKLTNKLIKIESILYNLKCYKSIFFKICNSFNIWSYKSLQITQQPILKYDYKTINKQQKILYKQINKNKYNKIFNRMNYTYIKN
jgi:hypothetical protein